MSKIFLNKSRSENLTSSLMKRTITTTNVTSNSEKKEIESIFVEYGPKKNDFIRICSNCGTSSTSTWRNLGDQVVCNACKCFYRKHGKNRPIHMRKDTIICRKRRSCKPVIPNEGMFSLNDDHSLLDTDSSIIAEAVCMMLEHLQNL